MQVLFRTSAPRSRALPPGSRRGRVPACLDASENQQGANRRGSVLLVVIGLLGMLLLLGIAFYTFAGQEIASSQNYADAAKNPDAGLSPEKLWEYALEQLIVGTVDTNKANSALWGKRHSLLSGILGRSPTPVGYDGYDLTPFDGTGVILKTSTTPGFVGDPYLDLDNDGVADPSQALLNFNYSYAANGGNVPTVPTFPATDTDYTRPDLNSLALSYLGRGLDSSNTDVNVIIPSFHRPQLLRQNGAPIPNWQINPITAQRVMRPHPEHRNATATKNYRFLSTQHTGTVTNVLGQTVQVFPFGTAASLRQGVWDLGGNPGLPTPTQNYQWDVDNDGDGVKEGIWMDLDFPVQTLADGRRYIPLFSFTVIDADGLINLNVSGNQSGLALPAGPFTLGNGLHISRSNMGLSRAEISPAWAMLANPATEATSLSTQHNLFWNVAPGTLNRMEMANSETLFLNIGRPEFGNVIGGSYSMPVMGSQAFEPNKYYSGRYDELELMGRNSYTASGNGIAAYKQGGSRDFTLLPQPGRSNQLYGTAMNPFAGDDDNDALSGHSHYDSAGYVFTGTSFFNSQSNLAVPPSVHPLDHRGNGVSVQTGLTGVRMALNSGAVGGVAQWPYYSSGYSSPGFDTTSSGFLSYASAAIGMSSGNTLMPSSFTNQTDEPDEIIGEWELANSNQTMLQDDVFGPEAMLELQATNTDLANISLQGRVRDLAPFNFKFSSQAQGIRQQYTVLSHDRKNFGLGGMGPNSNLRSWEFNADSDSDGNLEFPPTYAPSAEPFRAALRQLLFVEHNQTTAPTNLAQLRLDLNKLLVTFDTVNGPVTAGGPVGVPVYRDLTPHPITLPAAPISAPTWNADTPSGAPSPNDQEYWARYDRQRMARDLYVLLYTVGGGLDGTNYATTSNSGNALYSNAQLKEMAQFAVNTVDALDADHVITKFEYDKNLNDGWSLDDNAYADEMLADRAVVYGVEGQQLTFSEVLGFISKKGEESPPGSGNFVNYDATQINDSDGDRCYTYIELRNASPFDVDLSYGQWQIVVQADNGPDMIPNSGDETDLTQLTLLSGNSSSVVSAGGLFTIGNRGGPAATDPMTPTNNLPSIFKVEPDTTTNSPPDFSSTGTGPATWIVPPFGTQLSLDLIPPMAGANHNTALFRVTDGSGSILGSGADVPTAGNFLFTGPGGNIPSSIASYYFVLRRRAHPTRTMPVTYTTDPINHVSQSQDNPWVEVDRITLAQFHDFLLTGPASGSPTKTDVETALSTLTSRERSQPFARGLAAGEATHPAAPSAPYRAHTIGTDNSNTTGNFNLAQLHFDRAFASVVDLLSVPLYGPDDVTKRVGLRAQFDDGDNGTPTSYLAQERILRPQLYANMAGVGPVGPIGDNRWYRLFEFVEVPTQTQSGLRTYPYALRTSGAINLNMVRSRGILAGLVDDPDNPFTAAPAIEGHFDPAFASENAMLVDQFESSRDWWREFLFTRDGVDPLTGMVLPGTPTGRPFRSLGFVENGISSIDDTVLRTLPSDATSAMTPVQNADRRTLFEARTTGDRPSMGGADAVDAYTKHRLLRKVVNNSTNRSNVFAVWVTTRFFEAVQVSGTNDFQIGDVLPGAQDHRGFFVIDRSLPEQAYLPSSGKFDFRKFVQYRKTLQ